LSFAFIYFIWLGTTSIKLAINETLKYKMNEERSRTYSQVLQSHLNTTKQTLFE